MLSTLLKLRSALDVVMMKQESVQKRMPMASQWVLARRLVAFLYPARQIVEKLEASKVVTLNLVIPCIHMLRNLPVSKSVSCN